MRPWGPPIERIAADLRRLHAALEADGRATRQPLGAAAKHRGLVLAYDDALRAACVALEVPGADRLATEPGRAHDALVSDLEERLQAAGLVLHGPPPY